MTRWSRLPLRLRVALAFAVSTAVALLVLGVFLHVRVAATLDTQTRAALEARSDSLQRLSTDERDAAVRELRGDSFGQVLGPAGDVEVTSPEVLEPLLEAADLPARGATTTAATRVFLESEGEPSGALLRAARSGPETIVVGVSTEDVDEVLEGLRAQLLVGGALALLVACGLGYVVAGAALRPMERMRAHAATISARSSGERLPVPQVRDEVHRLGSTLNDMLDRLDAGLRRERQFVAEASHELRTPLALLRTELDLIASRPRSPAELAAFIASATEEVDRLGLLVDHLLLLARSDESRLELDLAPVAVAQLLHEVAARFAQGTDGRQITVAPGPPVAVDADRRRLDQAVSNLVDNALRHGAGAVTLATFREADRVLITVADEGGARLSDELFDRFRRGEEARAGGRGLGLSLVRAIVTEHGGTVRLDDAAAGTRMVMDLPA